MNYSINNTISEDITILATIYSVIPEVQEIIFRPSTATIHIEGEFYEMK